MHFDSAIKSLVLADDFVYIRGEYAKFLIGFVHVNPMRGHGDINSRTHPVASPLFLGGEQSSLIVQSSYHGVRRPTCRLATLK